MNIHRGVRAILADDERLMREQLRSRLAQAWPELEIAGEAKNGDEAVKLCLELKPELAFLDIRMPGMSGIEAARQIAPHCHVVFITAYDQYAVEAFEQGAVDYLLKPAEAERLAVTVGRLKARLSEGALPSNGSLLRVLSDLARRLDAPPVVSSHVSEGHAVNGAPGRLQWIQASVGQSLRLIPVDDVLFFQSDEKYTRVQTVSFEALIKKPIKELIDELDPAHFWQIHRSTVVNTRAIAGVSRDFRGRQIVTIKDHSEKLEVSRTFSHLFKQM